MGFKRCGQEDPFAKRVRETYGANVLGAPRAGVEPLDVLARLGKRVQLMGDLPPLIRPGRKLALPSLEEFAAAPLQGLRSSSVNAKVGVSLASGILAGMGLPATGAIVESELWKGANAFTFDVRDVSEWRIDIGLLGLALRGRDIFSDSPATSVFFDAPPAEMHIITRTLTSPEVSIRATAGGGAALRVSIDAVERLLAGASGNVEWSCKSEDSTTFRSPRALTFAFASVPCQHVGGQIVGLGLEARQLRFGGASQPAGEERLPDHAPLFDCDGLIEIDSF